MALARSLSVALTGVTGHVIEIEADLSAGLPGLTFTGLADMSVTESRDRIRAAVLNSGLSWPGNRITVALFPADLRKNGSAFDLAAALAILAAGGVIPAARLAKVVWLGELGLDGRLRPVRGALPAVLAARAHGLFTVVVPADNADEAAMVGDVDVRVATSLLQVVAACRADGPPLPVAHSAEPSPIMVSADLADVVGQPVARRALEIAAAGGHHLLLQGVPGAGKTMLAERLPGILPALEDEAALEVTAIHSVAGQLTPERGLIRQPPLQAPHHSASTASLVGGGSGLARPGAASLAHRGVLLLDEAPDTNCAQHHIGVSWSVRYRREANFEIDPAIKPSPTPRANCHAFGPKKQGSDGEGRRVPTSTACTSPPPRPNGGTMTNSSVSSIKSDLKVGEGPESASASPDPGPSGTPRESAGYSIALMDQHARMLGESGIPPQRAASRHYRSADGKAQLASHGIAERGRIVPGLIVPLLGVDGREWGVQYRPDTPRLNESGKPIKYETPVGQRNGLDIPAGVGPMLGDPSIPLWITEGSKKADAAADRGLACIALTGVWNWIGTNAAGGKVALPDWRDVALNGRTVVLAFDSDASTKPSVGRALLALADYLALKGAKVQFAHLPQDAPGKTGLDDYLLGNTVPQLQALVRDEPPAGVADLAADVAFEKKVAERAEAIEVGEAARELVNVRRAAALPDEPFDVGTLAEMKLRATDTKFRIEGLMPWAGATLISAQRKVGKTTTTLNLARALITGEDFLDQFPVTPVTGRVGILNFEVNGSQLTRWADEAGLPEEGFYIANLRDRRNPFRSPKDREELARILREHNVESLIVDPFSAAFTGTSQNDAGEVGSWLTDLGLFARNEVGATDLILTAHAGWAGDHSRGSSGLEDWPDSIISITSSQTGADAARRYMRAQGRDVEVESAALNFDKVTRRLSLGISGSRQRAAKDKKIEDLIPKIVEIVTDRPGVITGDISAELRQRGATFQKEAPSQAIRECVRRELIWEKPYGRKIAYYPSPVHPAQYPLAVPAEEAPETRDFPASPRNSPPPSDGHLPDSPPPLEGRGDGEVAPPATTTKETPLHPPLTAVTSPPAPPSPTRVIAPPGTRSAPEPAQPLASRFSRTGFQTGPSAASMRADIWQRLRDIPASEWLTKEGRQKISYAYLIDAELASSGEFSVDFDLKVQDLEHGIY